MTAVAPLLSHDLQMNVTSMTRLVAVAALLGIPLAACGSSNAASTNTSTSDRAAARPTSFDSIEDLRDAAVAAGLDCPDWHLSTRSAPAVAGGDCSDDAALSLYPDSASALDGAHALSDLLGGAGMDYTLRVGENWVISGDSAAPLDDLGGNVISGP